MEQLRWDRLSCLQMARSGSAASARPTSGRSLEYIGEQEPSLIDVLDVACGSGMALPARGLWSDTTIRRVDVDPDAIERSRLYFCSLLTFDAHLSNSHCSVPTSPPP